MGNLTRRPLIISWLRGADKKFETPSKTHSSGCLCNLRGMMLGSKKVVCVIPARLKSTRFPKKMLSMLAGKPLLQWVWERAKQVPYFDDLCIAVDAEETA